MQITYSKIFHFLFKLNKEQHERFLDFLKSPYFNEDERLVEAFGIIFKEIEKNKEAKSETDEQALHNLIFPDH